MSTGDHSKTGAPEVKAPAEDEVLQQYFAICRRAYEQHQRNGTWPWNIRAPEPKTVKTPFEDSEVESEPNNYGV